MIKGVNKQVLEVTNTENPYFEKIVFFVRTEHASDSQELLKDEAKKVAKKQQKPPKVRHSKRHIAGLFFISALCTGAGVALTFLINTVI